MSNDIFPTIKGLTWTVLKTPKFNTIVQTAANLAEVRIQQSQNPIWTWELIYEYIYDNYLSQQNAMPYSPNTDLREMMGFYLGHQGRFDDFLLDDPSDDWVGPMTWKKFYDFNPGQIILDPAGHGQKWSGGMTGAALPTFNDAGGSETDGQGSWQDQGVFNGATAQTLQLLNDGMPTPTYYSPLQRNMGLQFLEDITDLNLGQNPLRVWDDGVLKVEGTDYTVGGPGLSLAGFSSAGMYVQWLVTPEGPVTAAFNFYFRVRFLTDDLDFEQFMAQLWTIGGAAGKNGRASLELASSRRFP